MKRQVSNYKRDHGNEVTVVCSSTRSDNFDPVIKSTTAMAFENAPDLIGIA